MECEVKKCRARQWWVGSGGSLYKLANDSIQPPLVTILLQTSGKLPWFFHRLGTTQQRLSKAQLKVPEIQKRDAR